MTKAERRAVYQWYRSQGYSATEARAKRNRPVKVWQDYLKSDTETRHERRKLPRYSRKRPKLVKPPKVKARRKIIIETLGKQFGLNKKLQKQWSRLADRTLIKRFDNLQRYKDAFIYGANWSFKRTVKELKKQFEECQTTAEFYKNLEDFYKNLVDLILPDLEKDEKEMMGD